MTIGVLAIELSIPYGETIKERRNVLRSMKDMVRKKFNVGISDITEGKEITNRARVGIVAISLDAGYLQSTLANAFNLIESHYAEMILSYNTEFFNYGEME